MKLSIVIITKNEEVYLPFLLNSIKSQKVNFDYEIIVSDAFSEDKTRQIAKDFGCKIVDGGLPSKGRNNGAKLAKGKYIMFLDADVIIPEGALQKWIDKIEEKKADLATPYYIGKERDTIKEKIMSYSWTFTIISHNIFKYIVGGVCIIIKKDLYDKIKGFDENYYICEDFQFIKKAIKAGGKRINLFPFIKLSIRRMKNTGGIKLVFLNIKHTIQFLLGKKFTNSYKKSYNLDYDKKNE